MRLLVTTDTVGGVWTYALELARALAPHGVKTVAAAMGEPLTPGQHAEAEAVPGLEVHAAPYKLEWMHEPWEDIRRAGKWLLDLERQVAPDVIHLNGYAHGSLPWQAPVLVVAHSCVCSWWDAVKGEPAPPEWDRYRDEVTRGLHAADLVLAPTAAMLAELQKHYGALKLTRVVPNGRDASQFRPGVKEPFLLTAGRLWDEAKNVSILAAVAPRLPWRVYVAGSERHPDGGEARYPNVESLGRLSPDVLADWLGRASIYALPARYEPFGLSALEAGFAKCALVLGDLPSLREVWGEAAVFVPPGDAGALEEALQSLIADPERRESLAARARTRAFEFTPERMAAGYLTAYRYLLDPARETRLSHESNGSGSWREEREAAPCAL